VTAGQIHPLFSTPVHPTTHPERYSLRRYPLKGIPHDIGSNFNAVTLREPRYTARTSVSWSAQRGDHVTTTYNGNDSRPTTPSEHAKWSRTKGSLETWVDRVRASVASSVQHNINGRHEEGLFETP
jgi:hypothetical protein